MKPLSIFEDFILSAVKNDNDFKENCINAFGKELTYFVDADVEDAMSAYPFFVVYGIESKETNGSSPYYIVQFVIGIKYNNQMVEENGIHRFNDKKNLEKSALDAIELIESDLSAIGIDGCGKISIVEKDLVLTPIGVAEDIQAIITLRFEERKTL